MDSISKQILRSNGFFPKLLVGAILVFSIVGIPLFVGYLSRFTHSFKEQRTTELPVWNNWLPMLIESWELILIAFVYGFIPMGGAYLIASSIDQFFGFLWILPWIPTMFIAFACPILFTIAYCHYLEKGNLESILDFRGLWNHFNKSTEEIVILTLILWGVLFIGFPVWGVSIALGFIIYIPMMIQAMDHNRYQ